MTSWPAPPPTPPRPSRPAGRPGGPAPTTLTARRPEDLLAAVPVVLGFHPEDSVVLLTFGGDHQFHARLDLPRSAADVEAATAALLAPARRERVQAAALVVYAGEASAAAARSAARALARRFELAGITVLDALRADGSRWFPLLGGARGVPAWGVPYDVSSHPFTAQAVYDGRAVLGSRADLEAGLRPDPAGVAAVGDALAGAVACDPEEAADVLDRHLAAGSVPDGELAGLLLGLRDVAVRDAAWAPVRRAGAADHVQLWSDAVRRAPAEVLADAAAVLAYVAWAAGDGALAWCAIDRCLGADPANTLAGLVAELLERAVPPDVLDD
ncbi:DUF4192 domain-containing protein [Nocardioides pantholopis]|uniref:DUF4192 domain-containing protein n=1 Tax=Nocardioides pantholopis TaxID=2483798 RepID=UPI000FDAD3A7|nr:DUF4192 domain-containing protein [Nocardioides pantholopis]